MLGWQFPAAFWLLPLAALPIVIHLLRVHRANRMLFPSLRFVQPSRSAAVRLRSPSDWLLLLLRMSIVGLAICAVAAPVLLTERRIAGWNAKVARAIVVDDTASMRSTTAREAAHAELANATYGRAFEVKNVEQGIGRAVAWLTSSPPAKRELIIVSDFQRGTVDTNATVQVPPSIGLRLVNVGQPAARRTITGTELFGFDTFATRQQAIELTNDTTAVSLESRQPAPIEGLRILNATMDERVALLRTLAIAGTPAPSPQEPIAIVFVKDGAKQDAPAAGLEPTPLRSGWMLRTALRIRDERGVISTAATGEPTSGVRVEPPWTPLVSDGQGHPILLAATARNELVLRVASSPDSLFSAAVGRAALRARHATGEYSEQEIASIDAAVLAAWTRPPGVVDRTAWRTADSNDSRWCWLAALVLVGVEQWLRSRRVRTAQEVTRAAA
jgi:Aerotolerance regulator N-terminal